MAITKWEKGWLAHPSCIGDGAMAGGRNSLSATISHVLSIPQSLLNMEDAEIVGRPRKYGRHKMATYMTAGAEQQSCYLRRRVRHHSRRLLRGQ